MRYRDRARWALASFVSIVILTIPALWNRFPLLQYDTGGYLARWYEGTLVPSRAVVYGLILNAGMPFAFWPVLILQAALTVWIVALTLRAHGLGGRPMLVAGVVAVLSIATTLPWLTAILLTDIFCGLGVIALYLLLLRNDALGRAERYGLIALVAVSAATHSATIAVLMALAAAAALVWLFDRKRITTANLMRGVAAIALGALLTLAANYAVAKRVAWTPGGFALSFGRMLQDGIVERYLDDHCPNAKLVLCAYKDELPQDADVWFWGSPLFDQLGRFKGLGAEMEKIATDSLIAYPGAQAKAVVVATVRQLVDVRTGEGVLNSIWHTYAIIHDYAPRLEPAMTAARQQRGEISFAAINDLHYPVALGAMALLPLIALFALRRRELTGIGELAVACMLALAANAFVCGALSNPHDRYGARVVWLAVVTVGVALLRLYEQRQRLPVRDIVTAAR